MGTLGDVAESGYHLALGVQIGIPTLPVGVRLDGSYHTMSEANSGFDSSQVIGGGVSVVFNLPGVGLVPYVLGGVGRYRVETGPAGMSTQSTNGGWHGGFGVNLGAIGFGAFAEVRYVRISGPGNDFEMVPLTIGFRL